MAWHSVVPKPPGDQVPCFRKKSVFIYDLTSVNTWVKLGQGHAWKCCYLSLPGVSGQEHMDTWTLASPLQREVSRDLELGPADFP